MGGGRFDSSAYASFTAGTAGKTTDEVYTSRSIAKELDPKGVLYRESRDSADNPQSTPLIVGLDVTGSMGMLADNIAREGLGTLFEGILDRKPIHDPHVMFMGIGDVNCDRAPLQVSQFEADKRIIEQLKLLYLEHGGGGNSFESYNMPWYFAALHTVHDSFEKRGKRGYLFTVGDEEPPADITPAQIKTFLGHDVQSVPSTKQLLEMAQRTYDVYHIIIEEGDHFKWAKDKVTDKWRDLLGQKVINLKDYNMLAQTIVSTIEVAEGAEAAVSAGAWGGGASKIVHEAIANLPKGAPPAKRLGHS